MSRDDEYWLWEDDNEPSAKFYVWGKESMTTQNDQFLQTVDTNIGKVTAIQVCNKNRPEGLKKPYEYLLDAHDFFKMYQEIKELSKDILLVKKGVTYGMFLEIYANSDKDNLYGKIQDKLKQYLGEDAVAYQDEKQFRYETHVMFEELNEKKEKK